MRKDRAARCANEAGVQAFIHGRHHIGDVSLARLKQGDDLPLALPSMANHAAHQLTWIFDCGPVGWVINAVFTLVQFLQARQIIAHIAIGRTNDTGRPFHHMVTCKQRATFSQSKAEMVAGMPRRRNRLQAPTITRYGLSVL